MTSLVRRVRRPAPAGFERPSAESQKFNITAEDNLFPTPSPSSRAVLVRKRRRRTFASLPPEIHLLIAEHLIYPDALSLKHTNRYFYNVVDTGVTLKVEWLMERRLLHLECPSHQRCDLGSDLRFCRGSVKYVLVFGVHPNIPYWLVPGREKYHDAGFKRLVTTSNTFNARRIHFETTYLRSPKMMRENCNTHLMGLPIEILYMIAEWLATPFDESTPLDQHNNSGVKALSLVNRTFRDICLKVSFHRVRVWKKEYNLASHLRNICAEGQHILPRAKTIGPGPGSRTGRGVPFGLEPDLFRRLSLLLSKMPRLTDLRLSPFPTVKSLYVRSASQISKIFRCFPNLEAVNFNIHGDTGQGPPYKLSQEFKMLKEGFPHLKAMSIFKTTTRGWTAADIRAVVRQFPRIERLFLEGCIGTDVARMDADDVARLFAPLRRLRHLALTDEIYHPVTKNYMRIAKMFPLDPSDRWRQMATSLFAAVPKLQEVCIGRQVDFQALVFQRLPTSATEGQLALEGQAKHAIPAAQAGPQTPKKAENPAGGGDAPPNPPQVQNHPVGLRVIRAYNDHPQKVRLNFPPACWSGKKRAWWPASGRLPDESDMAAPDEPWGSVGFINVIEEDEDTAAETSVHYQEMVLDHCEVSFWDAEWLRVIRYLA
ncbi:uncharacterized protein B0H64DRAFT_343701 [Chaetomium fimeti]|uniref:F-box domain-containing protein n=1 Tax=Chaetomium fimeti TaxID=1854472 RepID=A0AAE0HDG5_9PEZI|nr:hypothetical protein B0H64DRAFT_343701 [Chaetomium fimeti]